MSQAPAVPILDNELPKIPPIRLDRSKPYGTVHGERGPDDPHYGVHFMQGGLPFDAQGVLVPDDGRKESYPGIVDGKPLMHQPLYNKAMREALERRIGRILRLQKQAEVEQRSEEPVEAPVDPSEDVNFESYLRGEADYPFFALKQAYERRFGKKQARLRSIIEDLVYEEKLIPEGQVHANRMKLLNAADAPTRVEAA